MGLGLSDVVDLGIRTPGPKPPPAPREEDLVTAQHTGERLGRYALDQFSQLGHGPRAAPPPRAPTFLGAPASNMPGYRPEVQGPYAPGTTEYLGLMNELRRRIAPARWGQALAARTQQEVAAQEAARADLANRSAYETFANTGGNVIPLNRRAPMHAPTGGILGGLVNVGAGLGAATAPLGEAGQLAATYSPLGQAVEHLPEPVRGPAVTARNTIGQLAGYGAADIATAGLLSPVYAAQGAGQLEATREQYNAGNLTGHEALGQILLSAPLLLAPLLLHAGPVLRQAKLRGFNTAEEYLLTPEGEAYGRHFLNIDPATGAPSQTIMQRFANAWGNLQREGAATGKSPLQVLGGRLASERGALTPGMEPAPAEGPLAGQIDMFTGEQVPSAAPAAAVPGVGVFGENVARGPAAEPPPLTLQAPTAPGLLENVPRETPAPVVEAPPEPLTGPAPTRGTDRSVRDHPQSARIVGNDLEITMRVGQVVTDKYRIPLDEWYATETGPTANPNYNRVALIERYTGHLDEQSGGPAQAARLRDSQIAAIRKVLPAERPPVAAPPETPPAVAGQPAEPAQAAAPAPPLPATTPAVGAGAVPPGKPTVTTVPTSSITFRPDLFQGRDVTVTATGEHLPFGTRRVEELRNVLRQGKEFGPVKVVPDPENPGSYIAYSGHHRMGAYLAEGVPEVKVEVTHADIRDPAQLAEIQAAARTENYKTAPTNFRERARDFGHFADQGESIDQIGERFRAKPSEVQDALDSRQLGPGALDRIVEDKAAQGIAAELGRGMRVYGINAEDANGMLRRFLNPDEGGKIPSRTAVRSTVDLVGKQIATKAGGQFGGFEGFGGQAMKVLNDFTAKQGELEQQIRQVRSLQKQVDRFAKQEPKAAGPARQLLRQATARERAVQRDLEALRKGLNREIQAGKGAAIGPKSLRRTSSASNLRPEAPIAATESVPPLTQERVGKSNLSEAAPPSAVRTTRSTSPSSSTGPISTEPGGGAGGVPRERALAISTSTRVYQPAEPAAKLAEMAHADAGDVGDVLDQSIDGIHGVHTEGVPGAFLGVDVKTSRASGWMRVAEKLNGRKPESISDYLRARVAVDDEAAMNAFLDNVRKNFKVISEDSFLENPKDGGYRAVHLQAETPSGDMSFELQIVPTPIAKIQETELHAFYDKWRGYGGNVPKARFDEWWGELHAADVRGREVYAEWPRETDPRSMLNQKSGDDLLVMAHQEGVPAVWKPSSTMGPAFETLDRQGTIDALMAKHAAAPATTAPETAAAPPAGIPGEAAAAPSAAEAATPPPPPAAPTPIGKGLFQPTQEELTHLADRIDRGNWTQHDGARIGAHAIVNSLLRGEAPSDRQFALLQRILGSDVSEVPTETAAAGAGGGAGGLPPHQPPLGEPPPPGVPYEGERGTQGAMQLGLADNVADAYVGALSAGKGGEAVAVQSRLTRAINAIANPLAAFRTIKASMDVGWAGRNGWRLLPSNPREWKAMYGKQYAAFAKEENFAAMQAEAKNYPWWQRAQASDRPLAYLEVGTGSPEKGGEEFMSTLTSKKLSIRGHGIPNPLLGSERAFVAPGNWMRSAVFDKLYNRVAKFNEAHGLGPVSDADFQKLEDLVNQATLRGNTNWLGHNQQTAASLLFSVKGLVSGPQFVLTTLRAASHSDSPMVRRIAAEHLGAYIGMGMTLMSAAAIAGYGANKAGAPAFIKAHTDPFSPLFGDISVGDFHWNIWASDASLVRFLLQVAYQKRAIADGLPAAPASRLRLAKNFIRTRLAPGIPSLAWDEFVNGGKNYYSSFNQNDINTPLGFLGYVIDQTAPIAWESPIAAAITAGPAYALPTFLAETQGASTSVYSTEPTDKQASQAAKLDITPRLKDAGIPDKDAAVASKEWRGYFADNGFADVPGAKDASTYAELRKSYVDYAAPQLVTRDGLSPKEAQDAADAYFDKLPAVKAFNKQETQARLDFWKAHPDLLYEAYNKGVEDLNQDERRIYNAYKQTQPAGAQ